MYECMYLCMLARACVYACATMPSDWILSDVCTILLPALPAPALGIFLDIL